MKILHLCLSAFYIEGMSYQENLLPQYHKKMGYDVDVIASLQSFSRDGEYIYEKKACEYDNEFGIHVVKIPLKKPHKITKILKTYIGTYDAIQESNPDIIFIHGVQFVDSAEVIKYIKKHPNVKLFADNHSDFSNSASNWISKNIQHKILWRHYVKRLNPYVIKFWGVLPARVDFLIDMYRLPKDKVDLLVMGADDELVKQANEPNVKVMIREKYGFNIDDFLIVTGGKIDQWKKQTLLLMDAVNQLDNPHVKLMVFGSVTPELKDDVEKRCSERVKYIGWVKSEESYSLFSASDIVCFPGRHSVFWEQVAGQGIPMICKYWKGTTHVDRGGNVIFLYEDSIQKITEEIIHSMNEYPVLLDAAKKCSPDFLYSGISKKCLLEE